MRAVAVALLAAGCGVFEPAYVYPDLGSPERALRTFEEAWRKGDLAVLHRCYTGVPRVELEAQVERNGAEAVAEYYRRGAEGMTIEPESWRVPSENLAFARLRVVAPSGETAIQLSFVRVKGGDEWKIFNRRAPEGR